MPAAWPEWARDEARTAAENRPRPAPILVSNGADRRLAGFAIRSAVQPNDAVGRFGYDRLSGLSLGFRRRFDGGGCRRTSRGPVRPSCACRADRRDLLPGPGPSLTRGRMLGHAGQHGLGRRENLRPFPFR